MKFALLLIFLSIHGWARWSITTYNIRNFDKDPSAGQTDIAELKKILNDFRSDVMGFQEIVNKAAFEKLVSSLYSDHDFILSKCGGRGKQHLALSYNRTILEYIKHEEDLSFSGDSNKCDSLRPVLLVTLKHKKNQKSYVFGVVHLKAGSNQASMEKRWLQYNKLQDLISNQKDLNFILLGDFNTTGYIDRNDDFSRFDSFLNQSQLKAASGSIGCSNYWEGPWRGPEHQPSILDHVIVEDIEFKKIESVRVGGHCAEMECRAATVLDLGVGYQKVSDHCPIQVVLK
jgi:endonuclease/exonuclease/phosphatase family metal-dependent hydrolase